MFKHRAGTHIAESPRFTPPLGLPLDNHGPDGPAWSAVAPVVLPEESCHGWFDVALIDDRGNQLAAGRMFYTDRAVLLDLERLRRRKSVTPTRIDFAEMGIFGSVNGKFGFGFRNADGTVTIVDLKFLSPVDDALIDHLAMATKLLYEANPGGVFDFDPAVVEQL